MKRKIKIWNDHPTDDQLTDVIQALCDGAIVIIPTDTVYGLACDALNSKAIDKLCRLKGLNPEKNHLSIICSDISMASNYCRLDDRSFKLLKEYTPGAYTFLLPASSQLPRAFRGRKTVGIRIPDNMTARRIAELLGNPVMTTSIDLSDEDYATNIELISENYQEKADVIVCGEDGETELSTIVDLTGSEPEIIRQGKGKFE